MWSQELFLRAWNFAADAHGAQKVPGGERPYLNHVGSVAMEVMAAIAQRGDVERPDLAVQCALLHDVVEDTPVTLEQVAGEFGAEVAAGVDALTKNPALGDKATQMRDSLARIRRRPREVWMVKLADRITNLQQPPGYWSAEKIAGYRREAQLIHDELRLGCPALSARLAAKIADYARYETADS
ncbi:MAG: HD domain-containing protein [Acidobacteria bacterium]|nr:HD domain-containing protein [Acidobacteriota bacterium]